MLNIFANETIYGTRFEQVGETRKLSAAELSHLNVSIPAVVFQGTYSLSCRLYAAGSTTQYYCFGLDRNSTAIEGQMFDVTKCLVTCWKKPDGGNIVKKILVLPEAIV
jgi:hypothetical protein